MNIGTEEMLTVDCYAHIIQSMTILYDVMVPYLAEQNCNSSSDWIINSGRFISVTYLGKVSLCN